MSKIITFHVSRFTLPLHQFQLAHEGCVAWPAAYLVNASVATLTVHIARAEVLKQLADNTSLLVISVGYRLAPEAPFPAAPNDCFDAAEWLVENAKTKLGVEFAFIGGESAGAHLLG